jgi:hypothetical protein
LFLFVLGEGVCWGGVVVDGVVLVEMWFGKVGGLFVEESMLILSIVLILLVVLI